MLFDCKEPTLRAPALSYLPEDPQHYRPGIGLIGCGGITRNHLKAYRKAGYRVVALCDVDRGRAESRRKEFYPDASVHADYVDLLRLDDVQVCDITTHPPERPAIVAAAIQAGKHVLSQKPFVLDLDEGLRLVEMAERRGVTLAVNQNARWAPHFAYLREAVAANLLGPLGSAHFSVHWDHQTAVRGSVFEQVEHLILYDYAIHWFDMINCLLGDRTPQSVVASAAAARWQTMMPPLLAQAMVQYPDAQASLVFDAATRFGPQDRTYVTGRDGTIVSLGPDNKRQVLSLYTSGGIARPELQGSWFPDGFHGTMGELLCSIEQGRTPSIDARRNLDSLALCFAAVASSQRGEPVKPWSVRRID